MTRSARKSEKRDTWEGITWIAGVFISVIIVAFALFDVRSAQIRLGNSTLPVLNVVPRGYSIKLTDILPSIAAILGTIFAIAFAFSQFVVPRIAENYSPRMVKYFRSDWRYRCAYSTLFLSVVTVSSLLLVARFPDSSLETGIAVGVMIAFAVVLVFFLVYYNHIYNIIDPESFYNWVANRIRSSIGDLEIVEDGSRALGDSALKALTRRGEDENVEKCIDLLTEVACSLLGGDDQQQNAFQSVLDQLRRIQDAAERHGDTSVTSHLYATMNKIGAKLFGEI
jgi:hypothetical protein